MFDNLYENKVVLVTGHTGFKGSWLTIWLRELGATVVGYSLAPPSQPNNYEVSQLDGRVIDVRGDVRDLETLIDTFKHYSPECVFHLAAQPIVRLSYQDPKTTFDTNVGGTVNVLEAVRETLSVKAFVNITSDKCYENREWLWGYRENDALGGHDPYSASKGCAELVFNAYLKSFFSEKAIQDRCIGVASARSGNVIGGGDWGTDRLVPDCIRALSAGQAVGIRNPRSVRPWQHVLEPLSGYLKLGTLLMTHPEKYSGAWNFGPDQSNHLNVAEIADRLIQLWGQGSWEDLSDRQDVHEAVILALNCDKARSVLKWNSVLTTEECLRMTVDWYKNVYANAPDYDHYHDCVEQIRCYEEHAKSRGDGL